jgi:hypothetical protein
MALADVELSNAKKGPPCAACLMEESLSPEDRDTLQRWMDDPAVTAGAILARLADEGYSPPSDYTFARHRARKCWGRRHGAV